MGTRETYVNTDVAPGGDGSIGDPFSSLWEWQWSESEEPDLIGDLDNVIVYCKGSTPDILPVNITLWETSAIYDVLITAIEGDGRHTGTAGTGYVLHPSSSTYGLEVDVNYITIDGIEIFDDGSLSTGLIGVTGTASNVTIKNCIIHGVGDQIPDIGIHQNSSGTNYFYNNIIYDLGTDNVSGGIRVDAGTLYAYNNTISTISNDGQGIRVAAGTVIAKNNLITDCSGACYSGTFNSASEYNASSDGTAPGDNSRIHQTFTFVGDSDYHLKSIDLGARNKGIRLVEDPNLSFSTDIDGETRGDNNPSINVWDIGADEFEGEEEVSLFYISRKKDDGEYEIVGYASENDTEISFSNHLETLGDGLYCYKLVAISSCGLESEDSAEVCVIVENGAIATYPQHDIFDLSVKPTSEGRFFVYFRNDFSDVQNPDFYNIYSREVEEDPSGENPSSDGWSLDGTLTYFINDGLYRYPTQSYQHENEIEFRVFPTTKPLEVEYERENNLTASAVADDEGPLITEDKINLEVLEN